MNDNQTTTVVVGIDDSPNSARVLSEAASEATRKGLPLQVVHARAWPTYSGNAPVFTYPVAPMESESDAHLIVDQACDRIRRDHPNVLVSGHVLDGGPALALVEESRHAALVVIGSRGGGGFAELVLGSTAMDVAARAACPVVIVRGAANPGGPVVVGVDGRPTSTTAIGFAFAEARARGVRLRAVHAWRHSTSLVDTEESEQDGRRRSRFLLDQCLREWRDGFDDVIVETVPTHHSSAAEALGEESEKAGLLVVGSRMRGSLRSRLLGSTGYRLIHTSRCTLVVVHPRP